MKQLTKLFLLAVLVIFASCENESTSEDSTLLENEIRFEDEILVSDGQEDKDLVFTGDSETMANEGMIRVNMANSTSGPSVLETYTVIDADRAPFSSQQPTANFWWAETPDASDFFDTSTYYAAEEGDNLVFTEYDNGTASIVGTTISGTCVVEVNVWLKDKKTWSEWSAMGGEFKQEGTAGDAADEEDMNFYIIDSSKSVITASGDCPQEGTFGLEQRPDPNDSATPNFGAHVGPGGANYDSNIGEYGLSTWGWLTDPNTGERLWLIDFNFRLEVAPDVCNDCTGKVTDLTLNYDWYCSKRIKVYQRYENTCYATKIFDGVVQPGEDFTINGSNANGTIGKYAYIYINNCYYTKIKTNCDIAIGPGYEKGVFTVVSGNSSQGGELCEYVPPVVKCYRHWYCYFNLNYCYYN